MGLFRKKADPISERSKALQQEIAALESQIKKLNAKSDHKQSEQPIPSAIPRFEAPVAKPAKSDVIGEPVFVEMENPLKSQPDPVVPQHIYNEFGVRKFDLPAALRRMRNSVRGEPTNNPKLVTFLAAGSIQGLRPLRYEKRVARNRFIFLSIVLAIFLWGILAVFLKQR